jgi:hypothetical protein
VVAGRRLSRCLLYTGGRVGKWIGVDVRNDGSLDASGSELKGTRV